MTPDTCGAAMLVPLSSRYRAMTFVLECLAVRRLELFASRCAESHEMIFSPGASRSGFMRPSPVGPLEEKYDTP